MRPYKGYINENGNFRKLFENTIMILGHVFETAYIINKITKEDNPVFQFDNDPTSGLIGKNNDWCLVGGDILVLRTWVDNSVRTFSDHPELKDIHSLREIDDYTVQILTDPWSEQSSIWQMEIDLTKLTRPVNLFKLKDFKDYVDKPYTDEPIW
ncbi:MAG: hypothetical protein ABIO79_02765 [Ferruginibacter sp.]